MSCWRVLGGFGSDLMQPRLHLSESTSSERRRGKQLEAEQTFDLNICARSSKPAVPTGQSLSLSAAVAEFVLFWRQTLIQPLLEHRERCHGDSPEPHTPDLGSLSLLVGCGSVRG